MDSGRKVLVGKDFAVKDETFLQNIKQFTSTIFYRASL